MDLLSTKGFVQALKYINNDIPNKNRRYEKDTKLIRDIPNTLAYKIAKEGLCTKRNKLDATTIRENNVESVILYLSVFYDGAQVYKYKYSVFKPLFISINNLPPSFRNKFAIGTFLVSLFTRSVNSAVHHFLFMDCFVRELSKLEKGFLWTIDGKTIFIQAILYKHIVDLKELEHYIGVEPMATSLSGCFFCGDLHGCYRNLLHKPTYTGHRGFTELNHVLRAFGNSKKCCPEDYYKVSDVFTPLYEEQDPVCEDLPSFCRNWSKQEKFHFLNSLCCKDNDHVTAVKEILSGTQQYCIYHENIEFNKLEPYLYYHHAEYRKQIQYERVLHDSYVYNAKNSLHGVKYLWFFELLITEIQNGVGFDPMHFFKNLGINVESNFSGERHDQLKIALYEKLIGSHPYLYKKKKQIQKDAESAIVNKKKPEKKKTKEKKEPADENGFPPYALKKSSRMRADAWINAIIVPLGHRQNWQIQHLFRRSGFVRAESWLAWMVNLMDFTLSACEEGDIPDAYKIFLSILSEDLCNLSSPVVCVDNLDDLYDKVIETISLHEGLYPEYESIFTWHQLSCIVKQMKLFGPISLWSAFSGERALGLLKKFVPKGGTSSHLTVFNRYLRSQQIYTSRAYNFDLNDEEGIKAHPIFSSYENVHRHWIEKDELNRKYLKYSDESTALLKSISNNNLQLSKDEIEDLIEVICANIRKRSTSISDCLLKSPLFRLYWFHKRILKKSVAFYDWLINKDDSDDDEPIQNYFVRDFQQAFDYYCNEKDMSDEDCIQEFLMEKEMLPETDYEVVEDLFGSWKCALYADAVIFGIKFRGRGLECREITKSPRIRSFRYGSQEKKGLKINDKYWPDNKLNWLKDNWSLKKHYSSWAKIRFMWQSTKEEEKCGTGLYAESDNYMYGQFNFFFQLSIPSDPFVHGLKLASVTCRRHTTIDKVDYILADHDGDSYFVHKMFATVDDIYSTPILQVAFMSNIASTKEHADEFFTEKAYRKNESEEKKQTLPHHSTNLLRSRAATDKQMNEVAQFSHNSDFHDRIRKRINHLRKDATPYYCGSVSSDSELLFDYANNQDQKLISYLVMLDMYRNRKQIQYEHKKDAYYRTIPNNDGAIFKTRITVVG